MLIRASYIFPELSSMEPLIGVEDCGGPIVKILLEKLVAPIDRLNSTLFTLRPCANVDPAKTRYEAIKNKSRDFFIRTFQFQSVGTSSLSTNDPGRRKQFLL